MRRITQKYVLLTKTSKWYFEGSINAVWRLYRGWSFVLRRYYIQQINQFHPKYFISPIIFNNDSRKKILLVELKKWSNLFALKFSVHWTGKIELIQWRDWFKHRTLKILCYMNYINYLCWFDKRKMWLQIMKIWW